MTKWSKFFLYASFAIFASVMFTGCDNTKYGTEIHGITGQVCLAKYQPWVGTYLSNCQNPTDEGFNEIQRIIDLIEETKEKHND